MGQECPFLERLVELPIVGCAGGIVAAHPVLDVLRYRLDCRPAGRFAFDPAADPVGDHHEKGEPLGLGPGARVFAQAGQADFQLLLQGTDEEVILILGANLSRMGEAPDIDLLVVRLAKGTREGGLGCGHSGICGGVPGPASEPALLRPTARRLTA